MNAALEELVGSLLYEGYALYPYTPGATKNATPTPFGIVYPPRYAEECAGAHDLARMECVARPASGATLTATLRYLTPSGTGHEAQEQRVELGPVPIGKRVSESFAGGRFTLRSEPLEDRPDQILVRACVHNTAEVPAGLNRAAALRESLISVHVLVEVSAGRFVSPLEAGRESLNIWPVLADDGDKAVLGAAFVLPDHPKISPQSHGNLFDNTEIEEALVLHVHSLTDEEREAALHQDRVVGDMLERALALGPEEIMTLHSGLTDVVPAGGPQPPEEIKGERLATVDGVTFALGDTLVLRPGTDRNPYDRMLDGRRATIERIYVAYDDRVHLAVTVNDDPGQELLRESGRFLFFFANEVELV
ncbi:MAG: hypothetical protein ACR2NR_06885 [Solirubrobacteraceae bacterium]